MTDLGGERYLSITTFRRDGTPVATPVWVVAAGGRLYVWTGAQTGKAKRVRANPDVLLAPCTARGTATGPAVRAVAAIVPAGERLEVWKLLLAKYRLQLRAIIYTGQVRKLLRRSPPRASLAERVYLELTVHRPELRPRQPGTRGASRAI
jgi:hypothetical protein